MQDQELPGSSGLQQEQTHGMKHSRINSVFGMFQQQTSPVVTLNSNSTCGISPNPSGSGSTGLSGMGEESSAPQEETPATDFHFILDRFAFTDVPVGTELRDFTQANNKFSKINSILRSSDPAGTKHPFCFGNSTVPQVGAVWISELHS